MRTVTSESSSVAASVSRGARASAESIGVRAALSAGAVGSAAVGLGATATPGAVAFTAS
jgi:hypothetical protein